MKPTRRTVVAGSAAGLALAAVAGTNAEEATVSETRQPVVYLPHGGGPWPFVDLGMDPEEYAGLKGYLQGVGQVAPRPSALLVISAHWEAPVPTVMTSARPPMYYDYYNFPDAAYQLSWPAPGAPDVATRVGGLLRDAGFQTAEDAERGFDHGTFIPLMLGFPEAQIPTVQLSLVEGLDPAQHMQMGQALAPLRDEGVFIVASGMSFHNMRAFFQPQASVREGAAQFATWLQGAVTADAEARYAALARWTEAPGARMSHPREEHLLPLMVAAGAAGADRGQIAFSGPVMGYRTLGVQYG